MSNAATVTMLVNQQVELDLSASDALIDSLATTIYPVAAPTWAVNNTDVALLFMDYNAMRVIAIGMKVGTSIVTATWITPASVTLTATYTITVSTADPASPMNATTQVPVPQTNPQQIRGRGLGLPYGNY